MWPSCAPNSRRNASFLFYKLSFIFVCLIVVVTVTLWESTNREAVNLWLLCCCNLQYIWGNNNKKTLALCVVTNWFGCSSFFFFWIRKKSYLPKVSTTQNSNEPEVLEGQRTFLLLAGETNRHGEEEHFNWTPKSNNCWYYMTHMTVYVWIMQAKLYIHVIMGSRHFNLQQQEKQRIYQKHQCFCFIRVSEDFWQLIMQQLLSWKRPAGSAWERLKGFWRHADVICCRYLTLCLTAAFTHTRTGNKIFLRVLF